MQRVKDAERELIINRFRHRVGELLSGTVKKVTRDHIVVDFGENAEGMLPREELVGREIFRINDRTGYLDSYTRRDSRPTAAGFPCSARDADPAIPDRSAGNC